jgi:hypothetical protein
MAKTYIICVEIFKGADKEYKTLKKLIKKRGFKGNSTTKFWENFKIVIAFDHLQEMNRYIETLLETIDHTRIRVTTEFEINKPLISDNF